MSNKCNSFDQYCVLASRTESYNNSEDLWQSKVPTRIYRLLHACVGISTELGEVQQCLMHPKTLRRLLMKELGDVWWYCAILNNELDCSFEIPTEVDENFTCYDDQHILALLFVHQGNMMSVLKRRIWYNADDNSPKSGWDLFEKSAESFIFVMSMLTMELRFTLSEVWHCNIMKLNDIYPEDFSEYLALNRNDNE